MLTIISKEFTLCGYRQRKEGIFNNWYLGNLLRSTAYVAEYNRRSTGLHSSRLRLYSHMFFGMEIAVYICFFTFKWSRLAYSGVV